MADLDDRVLAAVRAAPLTAARGLAIQVEASERRVSSALGRLRLAGLVAGDLSVCPLCAGRGRVTLWRPRTSDTPADTSTGAHGLVQRPSSDAGDP